MKNYKPERPEFCTDDHLEFLNNLRQSGRVNMWGASPYLKEAFPALDMTQARRIHLYWMHNFSVADSDAELSPIRVQELETLADDIAQALAK